MNVTFFSDAPAGDWPGDLAPVVGGGIGLHGCSKNHHFWADCCRGPASAGEPRPASACSGIPMGRPHAGHGLTTDRFSSRSGACSIPEGIAGNIDSGA